MAENSEEIIPLTSNISNDIEKYFMFNNNIETIRRTYSYGEVELHITGYNRNNEIFLLTNIMHYNHLKIFHLQEEMRSEIYF